MVIAGRLGERVTSTRRDHSRSVTGIVGVQLHFAAATALRLAPSRETIRVALVKGRQSGKCRLSMSPFAGAFVIKFALAVNVRWRGRPGLDDQDRE